MGVGVHQHIRTGVSCGPLHRLDVAAGDHQLIGGTGKWGALMKTVGGTHSQTTKGVLL